MNVVDPATFRLVSAALDAAALRHAVSAQDIANADVVGAVGRKVRFEDLLGEVRESLAAGRSFHPDSVPSPQVVASDAPSISLDEEMAVLAGNSLHYQALLKAMGKHLSILSLATQEGRR